MSTDSKKRVGAEQAVTSYIEEMLGRAQERPSAKPDGPEDKGGARCQWRMFDFGELKAGISCELISPAGDVADGLDSEDVSAALPWLHHARVDGDKMQLVDLRKLVLPRTRPLVAGAPRTGQIRMWRVTGRDIAVIVDAGVPHEVVSSGDIHRCGPDRRRKWLAGTDVENRSVFLDTQGLIGVVESSAH